MALKRIGNSFFIDTPKTLIRDHFFGPDHSCHSWLNLYIFNCHRSIRAADNFVIFLNLCIVTRCYDIYMLCNMARWRFFPWHFHSWLDYYRFVFYDLWKIERKLNRKTDFWTWNFTLKYDLCRKKNAKNLQSFCPHLNTDLKDCEIAWFFFCWIFFCIFDSIWFSFVTNDSIFNSIK